MSDLLEVSGLVSGYGRNVVLRDVAIAVAAGEIVALVGANGAGKSTLLNTIMGLVPHSAGRVVFAGQDITRAPTHHIVQAGLAQVPERRQLFGTMTVEENLLMGAYTRSDSRGVADDLEAQFEAFPILRERRGQASQTLSGGEQQMLAIGRAMMSRPKMLLLDEPSLGLAPLITAQIMRLIGTLRAAGGTILIVEQNARVALEVADRGYVIETGRVSPSRRAAELLGDAAVINAYLGGEEAGGETMEQRIRARKRAIAGGG